MEREKKKSDLLLAKNVFPVSWSMCSFTSSFNIFGQDETTSEAKSHLEVAGGFLSIKIKFIVWNNDG